MGSLLSHSCFSTTVWLYHLDIYETLREKVRWVLHKNAACYFQQIMEAAYNKTAVVWPLTSYLRNHARWTRDAEYFWRNKDKIISDVLLWTPIHGHTSVGWLTKSYMYQIFADNKNSLENLLRVMTNRDRWWGNL